jgi:hypothetical protein
VLDALRRREAWVPELRDWSPQASVAIAEMDIERPDEFLIDVRAVGRSL